MFSSLYVFIIKIFHELFYIIGMCLLQNNTYSMPLILLNKAQFYQIWLKSIYQTRWPFLSEHSAFVQLCWKEKSDGVPWNFRIKGSFSNSEWMTAERYKAHIILDIMWNVNSSKIRNTLLYKCSGTWKFQEEQKSFVFLFLINFIGLYCDARVVY